MLVDFVSSTLKFIGTLAQTGFDIVNNWQEFLETIDNITESLKNISPEEIWEGIKILYEQVKVYFKDADGLNWVRIAYITGYTIAFTGTMFIPIAGWIGKIAKVDKVIPDELLTLLKTQGVNLAKQLNTKTRNAQLRVLQQCAELLQIFAKGKDEIIKFFKQLADDIGKWFKNNQKSFKLVEKGDNSILVYVRILKRNSSYKESIHYIKIIRRPLGKWIALDQEAAVNLFTKSYYIAFNKALRKIDGVKLTQEFRAMQKVLDDALAKLPVSVYNNEVLQRSSYFTEKEIKKHFKKGKAFTDLGFFSTTYSEKALFKWMNNNPADNVLFKVYGKNGKLIEASSNIPEEAEVLFRSGTTFFVESVRKIDHPTDKSKLVTEIILKEK